MSRISLPKSTCPHGYTATDITEILGDQEPRFWRWMTGQTMMLCEGTQYHHNQRHTEKCLNPTPRDINVFGYKMDHTEDSPFEYYCEYTGDGYREGTECEGTPHGGIVYYSDLERFILGLPVID